MTDTERLDWLISHESYSVVFVETASKQGWRVIRKPITYVTAYHDSPRAAIDAAIVTQARTSLTI